MDPDKALEEIRAIIANAVDNELLTLDDIDRLVNLINGLDMWLTKGGFKPRAWMQRVSLDEMFK